MASFETGLSITFAYRVGSKFPLNVKGEQVKQALEQALAINYLISCDLQ